MSNRLQRASLNVAEPIVDFVERLALPGSETEPDAFWTGLDTIIRDLTPLNRALLAERDRLQREIDAFHRSHPGAPDPVVYKAHLQSIGYLVEPPKEVRITTSLVDDEITRQAGPQLVVPLLNARFAVNASNARWGSLYDALYGTDAITRSGDLAPGLSYNARRGEEVIAWGRDLLDTVAPLRTGSHRDSTTYQVRNGALTARLDDGTSTALMDEARLAGYTGAPDRPDSILLVHHGLHVDIQIDHQGRIGNHDRAGVDDIVLEAAVTTIMDLEDSVAAVDAEDKALGYRNWRELMQGTLSETITKQGETFLRTMNPDRSYLTPNGLPFTLPGRSLLLIRNVGHLMTTDAVRDADGDEVFEGILDAVMTALGSLSDLRGATAGGNSRSGSMYIVKPKMHGPDEVAFAAELFTRVEQLLDLRPGTIKIGIMDEERRTTVNLRAAIAAAADRVVFVNTGFLDRTGDDIHTSLLAGVMVPKAEMRTQTFMRAYENANVDTALRAGFAGRAQIGKGMWAMPGLMHDMLEQKIEHVRSGATTAWVPSPTAATLHALHYHHVDAFAEQNRIAHREPDDVARLLVIPLAKHPIDDDVRLAELDNNVQSILGYVVRWVDQGIGCSTVPNIHGVGLMEDRATLRISSQLLANWVTHHVVTVEEVDLSLRRLASVVDVQNAGDPLYEPLVGPDGPGIAYNAARELILEGAAQPSGYTEPILHRVRRAKKAAHAT